MGGGGGKGQNKNWSNPQIFGDVFLCQGHTGHKFDSEMAKNGDGKVD